MYFLSHHWLWLMPPAVVAVVLLLWRAWTNYKITTRAYGERHLLLSGGRLLSGRSFLVVSAFVVAGTVATLLALARPVMRDQTVEFPQGTVDVVAVVDVSRSMAAQDYLNHKLPAPFDGGTRLDMARRLIRNSLQPALRANSLGIVSFAGEAYEQAYLSTDSKSLGYVVDNALTISSAPGDGSNLWAAFAAAFKMFELDSPEGHQRVIVLFSDGGCDNDAAQLSKVVEFCRQHKVRVVIVGVGSNTPSTIPTSQLSERERELYKGIQPYLKDGSKPMLTSRDEGFMVMLADAFGGTYLRVDAESDFSFSPGDFRLESVTRVANRELFRYPMIVAVLALSAAFVILRLRGLKLAGWRRTPAPPVMPSTATGTEPVSSEASLGEQADENG